MLSSALLLIFLRLFLQPFPNLFPTFSHPSPSSLLTTQHAISLSRRNRTNSPPRMAQSSNEPSPPPDFVSPGLDGVRGLRTFPLSTNHALPRPTPPDGPALLGRPTPASEASPRDPGTWTWCFLAVESSSAKTCALPLAVWREPCGACFFFVFFPANQLRASH